METPYVCSRLKLPIAYPVQFITSDIDNLLAFFDSLYSTMHFVSAPLCLHSLCLRTMLSELYMGQYLTKTKTNLSHTEKQNLANTVRTCKGDIL